jgi:glutaminyl-peptide cyclotransferase
MSPSRRSVASLPVAAGLLAGVAGIGCTAARSAPPMKPEMLRVKVLRSIPHDPGAFTQGLLSFEGKLYESTGLYGESTLRRLDPQTGRVEAKVALDAGVFAEGLAQHGGRLFQITWKEQKAFVWKAADLTRVREFTYQGEGWGLCSDGKQLIMSDGSERLTFRNPETFAQTRTVIVRMAGQPVTQLNELEYVDGAVYANIWQDEHIARINPATGEVTGWIDASGLLTYNERAHADVLNGIALIPGTKHLLITGKKWPRMMEVELVPAS